MSQTRSLKKFSQATAEKKDGTLLPIMGRMNLFRCQWDERGARRIPVICVPPPDSSLALIIADLVGSGTASVIVLTDDRHI